MKTKRTISRKVGEAISIGSVLFVLLQLVVFVSIKYKILDVPFVEFFLISSASVFIFAYISYFMITKEIYGILGAEPSEINRVMFEKLSGGVDFFDDAKSSGLLAKLLTIVEDVRAREARLNEEIEKSIALINRQNQELMYKSRATAIGEMISNIAHQWRQPLNVISLIVSDLKLEIELDDFNKESMTKSLNGILSQIKYLSTTIDDFRNFFNPNSTPKEFNALSPVRYAISLIKPTLDKEHIELNLYCNQKCSSKEGKCQFVNDCHFESPNILGYKSELVQVYMNILKNAKDVLFEKKIEKPKIDITITEGEGVVEIKFADNGGGIDEKVLPKIFDPYFTTKHSGIGTGIGLYMCKQIVEGHHSGSIYAYNSGEGAVFCVKLPLIVKSEQIGVK